MFTADTGVTWCNVGAMVDYSNYGEAQKVIETLQQQGDAVSRTVRRLELERAALRATCIRAVKLGIPIIDVARFGGVARKTVGEWLRLQA